MKYLKDTDFCGTMIQILQLSTLQPK